MNKKTAKPRPVRGGQAEEVAPGVLDQVREAQKREVDALQQSHAAELKRLKAASKTREDQWRAREAKCKTERKSLQDRLLKAPKPQAGSAPVARPCVRATGYCRAMAQCALQNYSAQHSSRYGSGSWVCNPMS